MITHERFKTFTEMKAYAIAWANAHPGTEIEPAIYEEGVSFRPRIILFAGDDQARLAWYAFADEEGIDFLGRHARVDARTHAGKLVRQIVDTLAFEVQA